MHEGRFVFAQLMQHLPMQRFRRLVANTTVIGTSSDSVASINSMHGFCPSSVARKLARYRDLPACASSEAISPGIRDMLHAARWPMQRTTLLAHLPSLHRARITTARHLYINEPLDIELAHTPMHWTPRPSNCAFGLPWARAMHAGLGHHATYLAGIRGCDSHGNSPLQARQHDIQCSIVWCLSRVRST